MRKPYPLVLFGVIASLAVVGCPKPAEPIASDAGQVADSSSPDVRFPYDAAIEDFGRVDAGGPVVIDDISPNTGVVTGGYRLRITGDGFNTQTTVRFGDNFADNVLLQNSRSLTLRVPAGDLSGPVDVVVDNTAYQATVEGGFIYFDAIGVDALTPNVVPISGGRRIVATGTGFVGDLLVLCDGRAAADVQVVSQSQLEFVAPPAEAGLKNVEILSAFGREELPLALRYYTPLSLERSEPLSGPVAGGNVVTLFGSGFTEETEVLFGTHAATVDTFIDVERLRVVVPAAAAVGPVPIVVSDANSSATLEGGYAYSSAGQQLALTAVVPGSGATVGGEVVTLVGQQLNVGTPMVRFGGEPAVVVEALVDRLLVTTPAQGAATVAVEVSNSAGTVTLDSAFVYAPRVRLTSIDPVQGNAEGGTAVVLSGGDFTQDSQVYIGGQLLLEKTLVDSGTISGTVPLGSAGLVDVTVEDPLGGRVTLVDGFLYLKELDLLGVHPARGSMAGGTYARLYGAGFTAGDPPLVVFGDQQVVGEVRSDNLLVLRTPPHLPAVVDVTASRNDSTSTAQRAYTYYDPSSLMGGTGGDVVDGAIYLSVFHAVTGMPLEGVTAQLGTNPETPYITLTDAYGQATLSGPDVHGPQVVTVAAAGYESVTLVEVNASEVSIFMFPTVSTPSSGQPPPMPPPPIISGRVFGFAKELFDPAALMPGQSALCVVETTIRTVFSAPGQPQSTQYVMAEGGIYTIPAARPGRLAVVAVAGIYDSMTQEFRPRQIGFHRNISASYGDELDGVDVELTIPLNTELTLHLADMPYRPPSPDTSVVMPFLNLGGEGVYPLSTEINPGVNTLNLVDFPDLPGELLTFLAGAFSIDYSTPGQARMTYPYSIVVRDGVGDLSTGITLDPILGFPELIEPVNNGLMTGNRIRWRPAEGTQPSFYELTILGFDGTYWTFYVPGHLSKLVVPVFPELNVENPPANASLGAYQGYFSAVYVPGFDFDNFSYLDLGSQARRSWTQDTFKFVNANVQ